MEQNTEKDKDYADLEEILNKFVDHINLLKNKVKTIEDKVNWIPEFSKESKKKIKAESLKLLTEAEKNKKDSILDRYIAKTERIKAETNKDFVNTLSTVIKISNLAETMNTLIGNSIGDSSISNKSIYDNDELFEFKAKMLELIKRL
ncbi:MAG: hypothetical protein WC346_05645 [Methanogenium sp.]|jgi:K+/H+ antiporter YhaU regulatory subunit KhtT